jgi:hypothetical protein
LSRLPLKPSSLLPAPAGMWRAVGDSKLGTRGAGCRGRKTRGHGEKDTRHTGARQAFAPLVSGLRGPRGLLKTRHSTVAQIALRKNSARLCCNEHSSASMIGWSLWHIRSISLATRRQMAYSRNDLPVFSFSRQVFTVKKVLRS